MRVLVVRTSNPVIVEIQVVLRFNSPLLSTSFSRKRLTLALQKNWMRRGVESTALRNYGLRNSKRNRAAGPDDRDIVDLGRRCRGSGHTDVLPCTNNA